MSDTNNRESIPDVFPFRHRMKVQIRFNDIDTLGHVNNAVYFTNFDLGKAKYFSELVQQIVDAETGDVKRECRTIMVGFDVELQRSAPLEVEWIEALNNFEQRNLQQL